MMRTVASAAGLVAAVSAFTQPVQPPTYGSLLRPDLNTPVTTGQTYEITWTPTPSTPDGTVSLVLCNGPSSNCVLQSSAIEGVPASAGKYSWSVPCTLAEGVQSTASGYGMLVIEDGTGRFQYSTQFSVQKGASCSSSSSSSSTTTTSAVPTTTTTTTSTTSARTTSAASVTTSPSVSSTTIRVLSSSAAASTSVSASTPVSASTSVTARPSTFTGAAALPTAFVNVAGLVGAGLAVLAL